MKDASLKVFPKLELFNGWGIYAQNFEGQILKNVMLEGVKEGIVCLPVHDAVAVPLDHIGWACEEMRYQWDKQIDVSGLARVGKALIRTTGSLRFGGVLLSLGFYTGLFICISGYSGNKSRQ